MSTSILYVNSTTASLSPSPPSLSQSIMFGLLLGLLFPSVLCSAFVFYNFISLRELRTQPINRFIILLLIINFTQVIVDLPFRLYYLSQSIVLVQNAFFCRFWVWYDSILTTINLYIMAISSIERYIFVFHRIYYVRYSLLSFRISTFTCILIPTAWYTGFIYFYPCTNHPNYINFQCGALCYLMSSPTANLVENYAYLILPIVIIVFTNSLLVFQVLIEKRRVTRNDGMRLWRKNVRMISQLFSVAILYICVYVPSAVLVFIITASSNFQTQIWAVRIRINYFYHLKYLVIFGCPFMVLASQTKMHEKIKRFIRFCCPQRQGRNMNQVIPITTMNPSFNGKQRLTTNT